MLKRFAVLMALIALVAGLFLPALASAQSAPPSSIIVKLVAGLPDQAQVDVVASNGGILRSSIPALRLHVIDVPAADLAATLARYQADPRVERAEENKVRLSESVPGDPLYADQWALPRIGWDQVFGTVTPTGIAKVAILDTGVDALHPELAGIVVPGTSILDGSAGTTDPSGHGTWLAGIVAAQTGGTSPDGIAGVAYDGVRIMPVTVLNASGEGLDSDVIAGVIWAVDHGADVILMAFSNPGFSPALQEAIDYAWSRGVVLVAAAGNGATNAPTFPAGDRGVMGVGATDQNDAQASFSNEGEAVFIAAPGTDIQTTGSGDAYAVISGTSAAAAHVAGLAAFMKAVDPTLTNGVIVFRIASTADPAGTQIQTGNGRINMARALASTATESIQPAGAAPLAEGGPFVGPYTAAAVNINTHAALGTNICDTTATKTSFTLGNQVCARATGLGGSDVHQIKWYNPSNVLKDTSANSTAGNLQDTFTPDSTGTWTVKAVKVSDGSVSDQATFVVSAADTTPPVITPSVSGTAGANGWYTSNVTVSWTVSDPESGITSPGCANTTLSSETTGQTVTCSATNGAGLSNSASVTIKIDKTGPTAVALAAAGTLGLSGWYTSDVTISTTGSESISNPIACTAAQSLTIDTTGTTFNGSCTNAAGLTTNAAPLTVKLDKTGPTVTLAVTAGTAGSNGWYTSDVTISTTGSDSISGLGVCTGLQLQTTETTGTVFNGSCTNNAGLTGNAVPLTVKLDKTPPSATLAVTAGTLGTNGWYTSDVTIGTSGTDSISNPVTCTAPQTLTGDTAGTTVNGSCTNDAGLSANAAPLTVKLDKTPPTAILAVTAGTAGANGWYTSDVTIGTTGSDAISGLVTCTADQLQTAETAGTVFNGSCTNNAGLTGNAVPLTVKLDKTPPSATLAVTAGTLGANGWYTSDVTIGTSGTDGISSPVVCTGPQYQTTETAGAVFNGSCTNNAGLSANAPSLTVKLDKTPPTVTFNGDIQNGQSFYFGFVPAQPLCSATDNLSGVASCTVAGYGTAVGPHTLTATATDTAGNTATATRSYTVLAWTINGFFQPVDMNGVWNSVKGGSTVPLKFEVFAGPTELTSTSIVSTLVKEVNCNAGPEDTVEVVATGGTSLRYDGPAGQFIYNWQTPKLPGRCYTVTLTTLDGSAISALFKLK